MEKEKPLLWDNNLLIIFGVTLIAVMGVSSITPAFPQVVEVFGISPERVGLLIISFTLPGIIFAPFLGMLADRWGRKKVLVPLLCLFGVTGFLCALVRDFSLLLVLRFLQGIGAGPLSSISATLIGDIFPSGKRSAAMGYNASVLNIGAATFPALGGALASLGWYFPFFLSLLAFPVAWLVATSLESPELKKPEPLRSYLGNFGKKFRDRQVIVFLCASLFIYILVYGPYLNYFPFVMRSVFNSSPLVIGLSMSIMSIASALFASQLGRIKKRLSTKIIIALSFFLFALALLAIPFISQPVMLFVPLCLFGAALGISSPAVQVSLSELASPDHRAILMSMNGMSLRVGQTIGPLFMGLVFSYRGLVSVFYSGFALSLIMAILALFLISTDTKERQSRDLAEEIKNEITG